MDRQKGGRASRKNGRKDRDDETNIRLLQSFFNKPKIFLSHFSRPQKQTTPSLSPRMRYLDFFDKMNKTSEQFVNGDLLLIRKQN
jgi:hypothetical protein